MLGTQQRGHPRPGPRSTAELRPAPPPGGASSPEPGSRNPPGTPEEERTPVQGHF